jgi:predicted O-methyltransferase YrrM
MTTEGGSTAVNSPLERILQSGRTLTADGTGEIDVHSAVSRLEGVFLQSIVRNLDPTKSLEIGLAYGVSALFICEALRVRDGTEHVMIDPQQHGPSWRGIGLANVLRAGYGHFTRLIEEPSYRALPELERSGQHIDFAFIDGWHTFDFGLVDFFYIDRMLNVGGVVAFDDANWPAIRKLCRFVNTNLSYSLLRVVEEGPEPSTIGRKLGRTLSAIPMVSQGLRPEVLHPDRQTGLVGSCMAFRKIADDRRRWDHFVDF